MKKEEKKGRIIKKNGKKNIRHERKYEIEEKSKINGGIGHFDTGYFWRQVQSRKKKLSIFIEFQNLDSMQYPNFHSISQKFKFFNFILFIIKKMKYTLFLVFSIYMNV